MLPNSLFLKGYAFAWTVCVESKGFGLWDGNSADRVSNRLVNARALVVGSSPTHPTSREAKSKKEESKMTEKDVEFLRDGAILKVNEILGELYEMVEKPKKTETKTKKEINN